MNAKSTIYRFDTEQEARAFMDQDSGEKMFLCVFPSRMGHDYYISKRGTMYVCRYCYVLKTYMVHKIKPFESKLPRVNGLFYELSSTENPKGEKVLVQTLVYSTFALGYWDKFISIQFKDGNYRNCDITNLEIKDKYKLTDQHARMIEMFLPDYQKNFKSISNYLVRLNGLKKEDADDCTDDAFFRVIALTHEIKLDRFVGYWIVMASKMSLSYAGHQFNKVDFELFELDYGKCDTPIEIDLLNILEDETDRKVMELMADGYSLNQIGDMVGLKRDQVKYKKDKSQQILRDYLSTDKEIMKIYGK